MRTLAVDIEGLNLLLGGGIPILKRHDSFEESATLLVRGPPGSGKTILGVQLAGSLARSLDADVAYGCVELLPSELEAQHAGTKRREVNERVVQAPFARGAPAESGCRIFAGLLDLGAPGGEAPRIADALDGLLQAIEDAGGRPRVLVVDSLSDGYNLGAKAPRLLADELCKMAAQRGMILILLEEAVDSTPNAWSFATDTVIELDIGGLPTPDEAGDVLYRRARFTKNRFGPCEPGPHRLDMSPASGVRVYPNQVAHTRPWAVSTLLPEWKPEAWRWGVLERLDDQNAVGALGGPQSLLSFNRCVTLVSGPSARDVALVATQTGQSLALRTDVLLSFGVEPGISDGEVDRAEPLRVVPLGTLFASDQIIATALGSLSRIWRAERSIGRVFLGDLRRISEAWSPERIRQTLGTLIYFLRRAHIPVVLVETGQFAAVSPFLTSADVGVHVIGVAAPNMPQVTLVRLGLSAKTTDRFNDSRLCTLLMSYL